MREKDTLTLSPILRPVCGTAIGILAVLAIGCSEPEVGTVESGGDAAGVDDTNVAPEGDIEPRQVKILDPLDGALFPPEIVAPTFRWEDADPASDAWRIEVRFQDGQLMDFRSGEPQWMPSDEQWETIKRYSLESQATVTVVGVNQAAPDEILSKASISISTSKDEVDAPVFYREVNLPFREAIKDPSRIRWRFGEVSSKQQPPVVLEQLPVCGNCHSFSSDGLVMGMDVDYANDKGSYAISPVAEEMTLDDGKIITWSDYRREDEESTFGLLSQVSPDGRYVVSTVKDHSVFVATDDLAFSQLFFPIKGILVIYDRKTKDYRPLPGADDQRFVQSNPTWSPDGKHIVFARSEAYRLKNLRDENRVLLTQEECQEFLKGGKTFLFDLYRIPFNEGKGGTPEPLEGAANNGMSNYFPKFSPDGKWIVFCKAKSFMLLQPDSELYIMPADGGEVRRMRCNTSRMNSWHSWSPNGKWMVFSSKANSAYTQLFLTHIDEQGRSSPAILLSHFTDSDRAANIPEFVNVKPGAIKRIRAQFVDDESYLRAAKRFHAADDFDGAMDAHRKALEINPKNATAHRAMGIALTAKGMLEEAKVHLIKSIELEPDVADTHTDLGVVLHRQRKFQEAIEPCSTALRLDPENGIAQLTLGMVLFELSKLKDAKVHLSEAVRLRPNDPFAHYYLAATLLNQEEPDEAAVHYGLALKHNPDYVEALVGLASIRVTAKSPELRNAEEAVELATRACQLTRYEHPVTLDILGMAYALAGRFSDAVAATERALRIARTTGDEGFAKAIQERLELYKQQESSHRSDSP